MLATRTDTVRARIAPELKNSVEGIFSSLGMNSSQAIVLFFKQVELHNGLPFEVKIPPKPPLNMATMTDEEIDAALQGGFDDIAAGKCIPLEKAHADFRRQECNSLRPHRGVLQKVPEVSVSHAEVQRAQSND